MATTCFRDRRLALTLAPSTLLLVISGCSGAGPNPPEGILSSLQAQAAGGELFHAHCAICHGDTGDGHGRRQENMIPPPGDLTVPTWAQPANAARTFLAIRQGAPGTAMAPWPTLSDEQIWQLVAYIETLQEDR